MEFAEAVEVAGSFAAGFAGRLEVLEGPTGRRRWPDDLKARIVAESFQPGILVSAIARRHGISPQQLTTWRRAAREGRLALPGDADAPGFVPLQVEGDPEAAGAETELLREMSYVIEVEVAGLVVRLPAEMAAVVSALRSLP